MSGSSHLPRDRRAMLLVGVLVGLALWIVMFAILRAIWLAYF